MSNAGAQKLTPKEITALVVLMAQARVIANTELKTLANVDLSGDARKTLVDKLGLVTQSRAGRGNAFELSAKGWESCIELLGAQDKIVGSTGGALVVLLAALSRAGVAATVFRPTADVDPEVQVRAAYARLAARPGAWVTLADLRAALTGLDRPDVDGALRSMAREPGVQLIPVANLKSLDQRDKDAALRLGGEDNHVLSIGAS